MIQIYWSYSTLGVKRGAIYNSSTPPDPVITSRLSHEITPFWKSRGKKRRILVKALKNKYKTQNPRGFSHDALHSITHFDMTLSQRLGLRFTSHKLSPSWEHADREMGVNNGHPQCRLIEDNNTATLIRTQTRRLPTQSVRVIVCVLANASMLVCTWMWPTMPAWELAYPHICITPVGFRLCLWIRKKYM